MHEGRLSFTIDTAAAIQMDVIFIWVGTPPMETLDFWAKQHCF
jgi:UDP-glucose 6-dehydrogenase